MNYGKCTKLDPSYGEGGWARGPVFRGGGGVAPPQLNLPILYKLP